METSAPKTYTGSCHCGNVHFETQVDLSHTMTCNCSMCGRSGTILSFVPEEHFTLKSGEESLTDYQFNKKHIHHYFCNTCGIKPFGKGENNGKTMYAVNVRCLEGVEVDELTPEKVDGRSY